MWLVTTRRHFLSGILGALVLVGVAVVRFSTPAQAQTKDPNEYNYLPITLEGGASRDNIIKNLVYDQGYDVQCAAPQWKISPQIYGDYERYFELFPSAVIEAKGKPDNYEINLADASIPMIRGSEAHDLTTKISSLEAFFGVVNPNLTPEDPNSTGVIQNLTTMGEQCAMKMNNFDAIQMICDKLDGGSTCYMNRVIPKTDMQILYLRMMLKGFENYYEGYMENFNKERVAKNLPEAPVNFCDDFTNNIEDNSKMFGIKREAQLRFATALDYAPLDIDTLYRIAFLVIAPTQNEDEGGEDIFWFLQSPEQLNDPDVKPPIIAAFRIPDFMTNKPLSLAPIMDSSQATRRKLTADDVLVEMDKKDLEEREKNEQRVLSKKDDHLSNPKSLIYCGGGGETLNQCKENGSVQRQLSLVIMALVNGLGKNCDGLGGYIEEAGEISTPAGFNPNTRTFSGVVNNSIPQEAKQPFAWKLLIDKEHADNGIFGDGYEYSVETNGWVVAPIGTEMIHLDGALRTFFTDEDYTSMVFNNCLADYPSICGTTPLRYPIKGRGVAAFNASSTIKQFIDPDDPVICKTERDKNGIKREVCEPKKRQVIITLIETRGPMGVWGAKIGWMIRKIEETVRPLDLQIECTRTEDLFLGKCSIKPLGSATPSASVPSTLIDCPLELGYKEEITQAVIGQKENYLSEIKRYHPNTKMNSEMFDFVVDYARQNGWNPGVILALGREETAWGSVGAPHWLGCMAGDPGSIKNNIKHAQQQMDCVFKYFQTSMSCSHFMCRYAEGVDEESCTFTVNPLFPKNLAPIYRYTVDPYTPPITNSGTLL
jgi:hypothetical protein